MIITMFNGIGTSVAHADDPQKKELTKPASSFDVPSCERISTIEAL